MYHTTATRTGFTGILNTADNDLDNQPPLIISEARADWKTGMTDLFAESSGDDHTAERRINISGNAQPMDIAQTDDDDSVSLQEVSIDSDDALSITTAQSAAEKMTRTTETGVQLPARAPAPAQPRAQAANLPANPRARPAQPVLPIAAAAHHPGAPESNFSKVISLMLSTVPCMISVTLVIALAQMADTSDLHLPDLAMITVIISVIAFALCGPVAAGLLRERIAHATPAVSDMLRS